LPLAGCGLHPKAVGVAVGAAVGAGVGAALGGCPVVRPGQPAPSGDRLTTTGGAAVGAAVGGAAGLLVASFLQPEEEGRVYEARRFLVLIALAPADAMAATAQSLAIARGVVVERVTPIPLTGDGLVIFRIIDGRSVRSKVAEFQRLPVVRMALPDFVYEANVHCPAAAEQQRGLHYGSRIIRADRLRATTTGRGVTIALIDTGLDSELEALRASIADTIDLTGTGFGKDLHGTMVAGVMTARATGATAIDGVAPDARLVAIKACRPVHADRAPARCLTSLLGVGVDRAVSAGAHILNMSVAGPQDPLLQRVVAAAVREGRVVVAAAGNGGRRARPAYPGALADVIAVTAIDVQERLYSAANRGEYVDVAAPGVDIITLAPSNRTVITSGTSIAAGYVSATLALLLEDAPGPARNAAALRAALEQTARDLGRTGRDRDFGHGLIDACRAVERVRGGPIAACLGT
ncbi:MAG: S8 family peptidase, partial [Gemmatimonadaceae bacterium]